jgi:hypothetical protein
LEEKKMNKCFELVLCTNAETLGLQAANRSLQPENLQLDMIEGVCESSFQFWNGGPGYKSAGHVALRLKDFGVIEDEKRAREAVVYMAGEGQDFPSSAEIEEAIEALEDAREKSREKFAAALKAALEVEEAEKSLAKESEEENA